LLPVSILSALKRGDAALAEKLTEAKLLVSKSASLTEAMLEACEKRCYNLEKEAKNKQDSMIAQSGFAPAPGQGAPADVAKLETEHGLFRYLSEHGLSTVELSSSHSCNPTDTSALFAARNSGLQFGTLNDTPKTTQEKPWVEISTHGLISPVAVRLKHGWTADTDLCQDWVFEARRRFCRDWEPLVQRQGHPLKEDGEIFYVHQGSEKADCLFDRFRLRMTGVNNCNRWYLMVGGFEVFGYYNANSVVYYTGEEEEPAASDEEHK